MKIIKLIANNYKILKAIEITPQGNTVLITGKNASGKTSLLEGIVTVLGGAKYVPKKPIRDGEKNADFTVVTENWTIKRTFTEGGGGSVTVTNADGMRAQSPQALLDKIVGKIGFDPMKFIRMGETEAGRKEQRKLLMKMAVPPLDFSDIDADIAVLKQERSDARRDKERLEHQASELGVTDGIPDEEMSLVKLSEELQKANDYNAETLRMADTVHGMEIESNLFGDACSRIDEKITERAAEIKALRDELNGIAKKQSELLSQQSGKKEELDAREPKNIEPIKLSMSNIEVTNVAVRQKKEKVKLQEEAKYKADCWRALGKDMKALEQKKATRLSEAKMPLEGLSVSEDCVMSGNIPLSQENDAKKLEIGMAIAMAENPELRVILMKGNDLDEDSLKVIAKMAEGSDYQIWIERIEGEGGIVIEDGSVKE